ncbi:Uncharacterised protein [Klebsiella pneumoniae]|nr:Uncharacterised protein [Klebsiella pneumoniae]
MQLVLQLCQSTMLSCVNWLLSITSTSLVDISYSRKRTITAMGPGRMVLHLSSLGAYILTNKIKKEFFRSNYAYYSHFTRYERTRHTGMKTLDDFTISNWFVGLPDVSATPFAGYYFGEPAPDITYNSYNKNAPAVINGSLNNADGYISVNNTDYLDTNQKAPLTLTICSVAKRNAGGASLNAHMIADFSGSGSAAEWLFNWLHERDRESLLCRPE